MALAWFIMLLLGAAALVAFGAVVIGQSIYGAVRAATPELRTPGEAENPYEIAPGDCGTASTPLRPTGKAEFGGKMVDVISERGFVETGAAIRVLRYAKGKIVVRPLRQPLKPNHIPLGLENRTGDSARAVFSFPFGFAQ